MLEYLTSVTFIFVLFAAMLAGLEIGRWVGKRGTFRDPDSSNLGIGVVDSAIFALFGLLVAFTFSSAAQRFAERQNFIVQEANNIGTAWLRVDLLPADAKPGLRELHRKYLDSRLLTYRKIPDMTAVSAELDRSTKLQTEIWEQALAACSRKNDPATTVLVVSALNEMFDTMSTRTAARKMHPPTAVYILLFTLALGCAFLAGHGMAENKKRSWAHIIGFAVAMALSIYIVLDLEHPRVGFIRVDDFDSVLVELRQSMK